MTITTNETHIKNKTLRVKKTNNNTYLLHPNYEETTLFNKQRKHRVH